MQAYVADFLGHVTPILFETYFNTKTIKEQFTLNQDLFVSDIFLCFNQENSPNNIKVFLFSRIVG